MKLRVLREQTQVTAPVTCPRLLPEERRSTCGKHRQNIQVGTLGLQDAGPSYAYYAVSGGW